MQDGCVTAIARAARRAARTPEVEAVLGRSRAPAALDLLELTEFAWHDCYQEVTAPEDVVDDILVCSHGELAGLTKAARLAVEDDRDLRLAADAIRASGRGAAH
jgi:hypothetical protein